MSIVITECFAGQIIENYLMNKILLLFLFCLNDTIAQTIEELFPWSEISRDINVGMSLSELLTSEEKLMKIGNAFGRSSIPEINEDGLYISSTGLDPREKREVVIYRIVNNNLRDIHWSKSNGDRLQEIRETLIDAWGKPKIGYKARLTLDGIAKVTTEIFNVNQEEEVVISLSSALGETEVAFLDLREDKESVQSLFFSYQEQKEHIQARALKMTGESPEEKPTSLFEDNLADLISAGNPEKKVREKSTETGFSPSITNNKNDKKKTGKEYKEKKENPDFSFIWIIISSLLLFGGILLRKIK